MGIKYLASGLLLIASTSAIACDGWHLDVASGFHLNDDSRFNGGGDSSRAVFHIGIKRRWMNVIDDNHTYIELFHESDPFDGRDDGIDSIQFGFEFPL